MIAALTLGICLVTLLQFFVSYCHSLIAESQRCELSEQTREIYRLTSKTATAEQFQRLRALLALCPETDKGELEIRVISAYFALLGSMCRTLGWAIPSAAPWIEAERGGCAHAVAVVLDRRIAYNRMMMMTQQASH